MACCSSRPPRTRRLGRLEAERSERRRLEPTARHGNRSPTGAVCPTRTCGRHATVSPSWLVMGRRCARIAAWQVWAIGHSERLWRCQSLSQVPSIRRRTLRLHTWTACPDTDIRRCSRQSVGHRHTSCIGRCTGPSHRIRSKKGQ